MQFIISFKREFIKHTTHIISGYKNLIQISPEADTKQQIDFLNGQRKLATDMRELNYTNGE